MMSSETLRSEGPDMQWSRDLMRDTLSGDQMIETFWSRGRSSISDLSVRLTASESGQYLRTSGSSRIP